MQLQSGVGAGDGAACMHACRPKSRRPAMNLCKCKQDHLARLQSAVAMDGTCMHALLGMVLHRCMHC